MTDSNAFVRRRGRGETVTLKHVAERAGVAPITVSRMINRPESVSPALRAGIDRAIAELGYVPNRFAGALASADSRVVPVVVPSLANAVFIEVIGGIQDELDAARYQVLLANTGYDLAREAELVAALLGWSPPGIILAGLRHAERTRTLLRRAGKPIVEVMEYGPRALDMNVGLSHLRAGETMGRHLVARGYRDIAFVGCRLALDYRAEQRFKGFDRALAAASLRRRPPVVLDTASSATAGGDALVSVLAADPCLDAIFFASDDLAVGALLRAARDGIAVPGRVAIAGFNGLEIARLTTPRLTTVVSPRRRIGELAARKLLARLRGERDGPARVDVGFELDVGESA